MDKTAYTHNEGAFRVTEEMKTSFDRDGCVLVKNLFSKDEVGHIEHGMTKGNYLDHDYKIENGSAKAAVMLLWFQPGNDITGIVSRCNRIVDSCEEFLGGEVYHYHSKLMTKPPGTGGKFVWHQDYGYWYDFGFLKPDMMTAFIAVDQCTIDNGCLQIMRGSHKVGRIEHTAISEKGVVSQVGAEPTRVEALKKMFPVEQVEMQPGDVLFTHSNLFHASSANLSPNRRWALLCCYSRVDNNPRSNHKPSCYSPLVKVPDSAVIECTNFEASDDKCFYEPSVHKLDDLNL